ncbi:MAG TPA: hypothetical protein P5531_04020 [Bacteroidales bacterium]|nr:hypothetical protein [Bacteroidales bacterium]
MGLNLTIYDKTGTPYSLYRTGSVVISVKKAEQRKELMGEDYVEIELETNTPMTFTIGSYIEAYGYRYTLNYMPVAKVLGTHRYEYTLKFEGPRYDLMKTQVLNYATFELMRTSDLENFINTEFVLTSDAAGFLEVILANMERTMGTSMCWAEGSVASTVFTEISFAGDNCLTALHKVCDTFGKEFDIRLSGNDYLIDIQDPDNIGTSLGLTFEYGKGKGAYTLERKNVDTQSMVTRMYAFGSSRNIPSDYRDYSPRLKLSGGTYIENGSRVSTYGLIEGTKIFEDIYPHRDGEVTSIGTVYTEFYDSTMDFDLNEVDGNGTVYLIAGLEPKVHFNTGKLAGYEFGISRYNHSTKCFRLNTFKDERGQEYPNPDSSEFQISVGDEYVLIDIQLGTTYIDAAEQALLTAATAEYNKLSIPQVAYELEIDPMFIRSIFEGAGDENYFYPGDWITVEDEALTVNKLIRIMSLTRDLMYPDKFTIELDEVFRRRKGLKTVQDIRNLRERINTGGLMNSNLRRYGRMNPNDIPARNVQTRSTGAQVVISGSFVNVLNSDEDTAIILGFDDEVSQAPVLQFWYPINETEYCLVQFDDQNNETGITVTGIFDTDATPVISMRVDRLQEAAVLEVSNENNDGVKANVTATRTTFTLNNIPDAPDDLNIGDVYHESGTLKIIFEA